MRDRLVSWVVIAFLAVGCILPACGVMPGIKPQIEPPQLEERLAELESQVKELQETIGQVESLAHGYGLTMYNIQDDLAALTSEQQQIILSHDEVGIILDGVLNDLGALTSEQQQIILSHDEVGIILDGVLNDLGALTSEQQSTEAMIDYIDARLRLIEEELAVEPPPPPS